MNSPLSPFSDDTLAQIDDTTCSSFLPLSLFMMLMWCPPFGLLGLVYGLKTRRLLKDGNQVEARLASHRVRNFIKIGFVFGIAFWLLLMLLQILLGLVGAF